MKKYPLIIYSCKVSIILFDTKKLNENEESHKNNKKKHSKLNY